MLLLRRLAMAMGLLFALVGTQGPEFAQQYGQRLAGAIDELSRVVATFAVDAASNSLTTEAAVARLKSNGDLLVRERGDAMESDIARLGRLRETLAALKGEPPLTRLATFARNFDAQIARQSLADFEPAVPTSFEAFVAAAIGWVFGWASTHLCAWPVRRQLASRRNEAALARRSTQS